MIVELLIFVVVLSALVLGHEFGHFVTAKRAGIKVEEFGIGFPPRLFAFRRGETEYSLNVVPFGAFVRILGEEDPTEPRSFARAPKLVRTWVLLAGVLMNALIALLLLIASFMTGWPTVTESQLELVAVNAGSPAAEAGIKPGDHVLTVAGVEVQSAQQFSSIAGAHLGQPIAITVEREGLEVALTVTPRPDPPPGEGPMGITITNRPTKVEPVRYPLGAAIVRGSSQFVGVLGLMASLPSLVLHGQVPLETLRPVGPVGIYQITSQATTETVATGWWFPIVNVAAMVSLGMALANILPIPGLDGGRLLFVLIEAVRGRRISPKREGLIHFMGIAILMAMMLIITYYDILAPLPAIDWGVR
ncbi:MAG: site-2 protease family protein [Chloroflexi bacterium]|nr:site-2 protease family protein [Chloroflexota bacterium]